MIRINSQIQIDESELIFRFVRASGPGGQNVNKVASAVQLRFNVRQSTALNDEVRERLLRIAGSRISSAGVLVIEAKRYRTQQANRQDALDRFVTLLKRAAKPPKRRRTTRPTAASREKRLDEKRRRSGVKRLRRRVTDDAE